MSMTAAEFWTVVHGMVFGAIYLLAFAGGLAGLYSLRPELVTPQVVVMQYSVWSIPPFNLRKCFTKPSDAATPPGGR